jgi:hypothetical protein
MSKICPFLPGDMLYFDRTCAKNKDYRWPHDWTPFVLVVDVKGRFSNGFDPAGDEVVYILQLDGLEQGVVPYCRSVLESAGAVVLESVQEK